MKLILLKKRQFLSIVLFFTICILTFFITLPFGDKEETAAVFNSQNNDDEISKDLNGDGQEDTAKIVKQNDYCDILITCNNKKYYLSELCDNKILCDNKSYWPLKFYLTSLERNNTPEIIVQGSKNSKSIFYIFSWNNNSFKKLYESSKNIFGILDYKTNKTPQCYSIDSLSGSSSLYSFMIIDNKDFDITKDCKSIQDFNPIQKFIDLIQTDYELDEIPDIFTEDISQDELAGLWHLDKELNMYSYQSGFFHDEENDSNGNASSLKWCLTFEKYVKSKDDSSKSQISVYVTTTRLSNNTYRISSFYIK